MSERVYFYNGTIEEQDGKLVQVGYKCKKCGKITFPKAEACMYCGDYTEEPEKVQLATEGTVYSYSVNRVGVGPFEAPFCGAYINLMDGVRIYGQIRDIPVEEIRTGMKVKVQIGTLYTKPDGTEVTGYWYVPEK